jgi:hypothetical protein
MNRTGACLLYEIRAMISVQSPGGLVFGSAKALEDDALSFEVDARLDIDKIVEFRLELPGLDETAMGTLRTIRTRKQVTGAELFTARIASIHDDDREIFEVWRAAVLRGTRAMTHSRHANTDAWLASSSMQGSTASERAHAVANQEERRRRRLMRARQIASLHKRSWPDPTDTDGAAAATREVWRPSLAPTSVSRPPPVRSSAPSMERPGAPAEDGPDISTPRSAIAAALRSRLGIGGAEPPPAPTSSEAAEGASSGEVKAPHLGTAAAPTPPKPPVPIGPEPAIEAGPGTVALTYWTEAKFREDYTRNLRLAGMFVPRRDLGARGQKVAFRVTLPSGTTLACAAEIVMVNATGSGLYLVLDAAQKDALARG